ncbi:hypothetical protein LCI18_009621 [Fusarium solani-melongenae]|uniref:Uncharacterized protein n=1 Tax=Fusarium solani subsp. cucurbitae TaxID=2747967 RepID=A0ACD3ZC33_FUSSC|nr:hypothetical protein LCI18_009621 [Fusarium solani-melongenae]
MPPRKSNSRKSDTSTARFVPMDDATPTESSPAPTPAAAATPAPASTPAPAAAEAVDTSSPTAAAADKKDKDKDKDKDHKDAVTIEDLTLPKSIITRLAKGVLPPNTQIQANAILALSQSTTVFINYLASHANENTINAGKKTIAPADVFKALEDTEFSFLRAPLEAEFAKFNAIQTEKRTSYRQKVRAKKTDGPDTDMPDTSHVETDADPDTTLVSEASGPRTKRARVDPASAGAAAEVEEDAETEEDEPVPEDDDDDEVEEEEEEEEDEGEASGDETQDALEIKEGKEERDEALDGDDSD